LLSLSARRVWIEIASADLTRMMRFSHSPRGGCGLKLEQRPTLVNLQWSLSARRVWIEIITPAESRWRQDVTLREEGVD